MTGGNRSARAGLMAVVVVHTLLALRDSALAQAFGMKPHPGSGSGLLPQSDFVAWIFTKQSAFYRSLAQFIRASKDDGAAMWSLFGISFLYGVFHAMGPGHGKAVISSYLVANEETWRRGVVLSFASAGIQSVVAVVVVAIAAVMLGATARAIGTTVHVVEIVSYVGVILIGLRLLFVKGRSFWMAYRARVPAGGPAILVAAPQVAMAGAGGSLKLGGAGAFHCAQCEAEAAGFQCADDPAHEHHASAWSHAHGPTPAELGGADGWRRGLSAVIAVGLRPCSGAIIVLVFMGLGTAITVAAIATLAVGAREVASRIANARSGVGMLVMRAVEVGASALVVAFGVLLLLGYMASEQLWMFTG
jgi:nickel/cobalt exporter